MIEIRSLRDILRLFFIFRREFTWAVVVTIIVAFLGAYLLPARYESDARLLVKPSLENTTLPIEAGNRPALIAPSTQRDPIVDEEKMLTGRPIVYKVAERYISGMSDNPPEGFWKEIKFQIKKMAGEAIELFRQFLQMLDLVEKQSPEERLAKKLEKQFEASHAPGSAVIEITFTWDDPVVAQKIVETWIDFYLEERSRALGRKSLYPFYETETRKTSEQIAQIKQEMLQRLQGIDSFSIRERLESMTMTINKANEERFQAQNTLAGLQSSMEKARKELNSLPAEVVTERQISLNPTQQDLKLKLNELQLERVRLQRTYKDEAPPLVQINKNIAALEKQIAGEAAQIQRSENRAPNALALRLKQSMQDGQLRIDQLKIQIKELDEYIKKLTDERLKVLGDEPELTRLQRELQTAEQNYTLYADSLEKARIERELENSRISNIAIVEHATFNPSRIFPKSLMIILLSFPVGLAVGFLTIYLCYLLDQRIHDGGLIEKEFSVPLWASLQDLGNNPNHPTRVFAANLYRMYGMLPLEKVEEKGLTVGVTSALRGEGVSFVVNYLCRLLVARGHRVRVGKHAAGPGEIVLIDASGLLKQRESFVSLRQADIVILVVEARKTTIPVVEHVLSIISAAFLKVDGIVINRRRFEIPARVLNMVSRLRSQS